MWWGDLNQALRISERGGLFDFIYTNSSQRNFARSFSFASFCCFAIGFICAIKRQIVHINLSLSNQLNRFVKYRN